MLLDHISSFGTRIPWKVIEGIFDSGIVRVRRSPEKEETTRIYYKYEYILPVYLGDFL